MTISEQIENDLRAHIVVGEEPPYPLTLSGIAKHFKVSLMPARAAVDLLVNEKYLIRAKNGSLSINARRRSRDPSVSFDSIKRTAPVAPEKKLTEHVINLSLQGADECLREEATAEQFEIGRTVLRRIFNRLSGEGIIEHLPRRGWRIRPYSEKDMLDYIDFRETLEVHALDLSRTRLNPDFLCEVLEGNTPGPDGKPRLDNRLHQHWIERTDNRFLREFFDQHGIYYDTLFARAVLDNDTVSRRASEHRRILKALLDNDIPKAKAALSKHITDQRNHVARLFEESGSSRTQ
jgi:DNA-binding GntR family transcriptional regulator